MGLSRSAFPVGTAYLTCQVHCSGGTGPEGHGGNNVLPWVFPGWWLPLYGGRIPGRSCDPSQRADRVGSDRGVQVDVLTNVPVLPATKERKIRRCQDLLTRDEEMPAKSCEAARVRLPLPSLPE
jgi:hypothetical protein